MKFKKPLLVLSLLVASLATSCTTRYQDMLRERDERIRELSGDVARLRGENDELQRRLASKPQPVEASTQTSPQSLLDELRHDLGPDAKVDYRRGRISIGVEDSVTFDSGSQTLKNSSHQVLKSVAAALRSKFPGRRYYVEGHTDTDPIKKTRDKYRDNMHLSLERADAVARYLMEQGVPKQSVVVVGYGQWDPRDPSNKARNRRVEIVVGDEL